MKKICLAVLVILGMANLAQADTLYLNNGRVIQGKIIKETEFSVQIRVNNINYNYYHKEIGKIERDQPKEESQDVVPPPVETLPLSVEPLTEKKKELILRLLTANQARENMGLIFMAIVEQAPKESRDHLKEILKVDEIIERLIPVYSKYYNEQDLTDLITFYSSPTGKKNLQITPKLLEDTMQEAVKYFQEKVAEQ